MGCCSCFCQFRHREHWSKQNISCCAWIFMKAFFCSWGQKRTAVWFDLTMSWTQGLHALILRSLITQVQLDLKSTKNKWKHVPQTLSSVVIISYQCRSISELFSDVVNVHSWTWWHFSSFGILHILARFEKFNILNYEYVRFIMKLLAAVAFL